MSENKEMALEERRREYLRAWNIKPAISRCLETCTHSVAAA